MDQSSINFQSPSNADSNIAEGSSRALSAVLLAILTVVSFLGNICLIATILSSRSLRSKAFNILIMNLSAINLLDTMFNTVLSLAYVAKGTWTFGDIICRAHATGGQLVALETVAAIALLAVDRSIVLLNTRLYTHRLTSLRLSAAVVLTWAIGLLFVAPIMFDGIPSMPYASRYFCAIAPRIHIGYSLSFIIIYVLVLVVILLCFGLIMLKAQQERQRRRERQLPQRPSDYTDVVMGSRVFNDHLNLGKFIVLVFCVYFVLQAPYLIMAAFMSIRNSEQVLLDGYDQLSIPGDAETAITWLRVIFPDVFPPLVFGFCSDIWLKFTLLACCRRNNDAIVDTSMSRQDLMRYDSRTDTMLPQEHDRTRSSGVLTILATGDGLKSRHGGRRQQLDFADVAMERQLTSDYDSEDSGTWADALHPISSARHRQPHETSHANNSVAPMMSQSEIQIAESAPNNNNAKRQTSRNSEVTVSTSANSNNKSTTPNANKQHKRSKSANNSQQQQQQESAPVPNADVIEMSTRSQPNKPRPKSATTTGESSTSAATQRVRQRSDDTLTSAFRPKRERSFNVQQSEPESVHGLTEVDTDGLKSSNGSNAVKRQRRVRTTSAPHHTTTVAGALGGRRPKTTQTVPIRE